MILIATVFLFTPTPTFAMWKVCYAEDKNHPNTGIAIRELPRKTFNELLPNAKDVRYYLYGLSLLFGPGVVIANLIFMLAVKRA